MNLQKLITDSICGAAANVFSTMLGNDLPEGQVSIETGTPEPNDGVVSFIGIAGKWVGTGSITCSPALACRVCSLMLMVEASAVDADVLDAVAELTNMIIGSVKTDLEQHLGPLGLSIPTVVYGRNFRTKSAGQHEWIVVTYLWDGEPLTVKLCLALSERSTHFASSIHVQALEV
ncbi:MAG TPA: chemotaxis protein CheX [Candidatus Acidoferrum sp.]|jgi:chemotaxis protein CheX|nr:chemotaxis protein CheX [Candidatus Acidoferrum sp.]